MSERTVRVCDECGVPHGVVNNWWCVVGSGAQPKFVDYESAQAMARNQTYEIETFRLDYCSHKCVGTAFHRWLDTGDVRVAPAVDKTPEEGERCELVQEAVR